VFSSAMPRLSGLAGHNGSPLIWEIKVTTEPSLYKIINKARRSILNGLTAYSKSVPRAGNTL